jgi:hypothetical protein
MNINVPFFIMYFILWVALGSNPYSGLVVLAYGIGTLITIRKEYVNVQERQS